MSSAWPIPCRRLCLYLNPGSPWGQVEWEGKGRGGRKLLGPLSGWATGAPGLPGTHYLLDVLSCCFPHGLGLGRPPPSPLHLLPSKDRHCFGTRALDSWNKLCLATLLDTDVSNPMEYEFNFQLEIRGPCLLAGERAAQMQRLWKK